MSVKLAELFVRCWSFAFKPCWSVEICWDVDAFWSILKHSNQLLHGKTFVKNDWKWHETEWQRLLGREDFERRCSRLEMELHHAAAAWRAALWAVSCSPTCLQCWFQTSEKSKSNIYKLDEIRANAAVQFILWTHEIWWTHQFCVPSCAP